METKNENKSRILTIVLAGVLALAGAIAAVVMISSNGKKDETTTSAQNENGNTDINIAVEYDNSGNKKFYTIESSVPTDNNGLSQTASSGVSATATNVSGTTQPKKTAETTKKISADKFSELGISGFELRKIKFITSHYGFWHNGKIMNSSDALYSVSAYIQEFAGDYGFNKTNNWKSAPTVFADKLSARNHKVVAALSIDDFNRVLRDIYGPSAEQFTYSDFIDYINLDASFVMWHTKGASKGSSKCSECLVIAEYIDDFESNDVDPDFTAFKIEGNLISALWLEKCSYFDVKEPTMWFIQKSMFARGSNGYYLHSVNHERYGGGETDSIKLKELSDYEIYDISSGKNEVEDMDAYFPEFTTVSKETTQKTEKYGSVEQAYIEYIANRKHNGIETDFVETSDEGYSFYDLNGDGVKEMIIIGLIPSSGGWHYCRLYKCDPETYKVTPASDLIYYYSVVRFSPKHSSLVYCPYKGNSYYMSFAFTKYDGNYSKDWIEIYTENNSDGTKTTKLYNYQTEEVKYLNSSADYTGDNINIETKPISEIKAK